MLASGLGHPKLAMKTPLANPCFKERNGADAGAVLEPSVLQNAPLPRLTLPRPSVSPLFCPLLVLLLSLVAPELQAQWPSLDEAAWMQRALRDCQGEDCAAWSDSLAHALEQGLSAEGAFDEWPDQLDFMAAVRSGDGRLRVFTWNWPLPDRTSGYGGLVAVRDSQGALTFTRLFDESSADRPDEQRMVGAEAWHGALYYAIVPDAVDKNTWFLLGWDDGDAQVTRKVIEPIEIRQRGPRFGAPLLQTPRGMLRRHVLEYADAVQVSLRHHPRDKGRDLPESILFDHLAPLQPHLSGIPAYAGPDMTFDGFVAPIKRRGPWLLQENMDIAHPLPDDRPFLDPRPRNQRRNRR